MRHPMNFLSGLLHYLVHLKADITCAWENHLGVGTDATSICYPRAYTIP